MVIDFLYILCRNELLSTIENERVRYFSVNDLRNLFRDVEIYVIPLLVAAVSWVLSILVDKTCSHDVCEVGYRI